MENNVKELEFAGGNGLELNEYIASDEFKKEMKRTSDASISRTRWSDRVLIPCL